MGNRLEQLHDVGVAGIHRLLDKTSRLRKASVIIVVAGMEGALPGVVSGLVDVPVAVVNIDNGFGAGFAASRIGRMRSRA
jgi:NCAIR mutase (PurE)-related protein